MTFNGRIAVAAVAIGCLAARASAGGEDSLHHTEEVHLQNIRQLTFGGENAEAYFSKDGTRLVFQSTRDSLPCDQIFTMTVEGDDVRMVSTGTGRTTCAYWSPDGTAIIYASTHLQDSACPTPPDFSQGYVWGLFGGYDVFRVDVQGSPPVRLTATPGYDAEAVYSNDGSKILFTSARDGDLELYAMNSDGSDPERLTYRIGYDGGGFFSPGDSMICWRAHYPADSAAEADYLALLREEKIRPTALELFVMQADGSNQRQVTELGGANFCPYFLPDGRGLIFASNHHSENGREFDLFVVDLESGVVQQITYMPAFDGFPMFSPDGTKLVWCSNRNGRTRGETNVFIADWVWPE